ncbi:MAG TPA: hypothetical protein VKG38_11085 [Solirubrobacteraceae bacterium]|nr:hypothetical protein [Solirubrobacteraceae bacterium]
MSTRIVFDGGSEILVAQDEEDVVHAIRRDHPNPVTLESTTGGPLHINWNRVAFIAEVLAGPPIGE